MGSIPLPALDIRPPENPLDQYAKALSVKSMLQGQQLQKQAIDRGDIENQEAAQKLADQKAMTSAMQEWDGKSYEDLIPLAKAHGASSNQVLALSQSILDRQEKKSVMAKNDAEKGKNNLETEQKKNDMLLGHFDALKDVPDEQLINAAHTEKNAALAGGYIDKAHADSLDEILASNDPVKIRKALDIY